MGFASDFADVLKQTVTVSTSNGRGTDGAATFSTSATTYAARVVNAHRQIRDLTGNVVMSQFDVWIASTGTIAPDSKVVLPDGTSPPLLVVAAYPDENGAHFHNKLTFGW